MIDEDTGEEPTCVICGGDWVCERHLVACLDGTFGECIAGALYERDEEFWWRIDEAFDAQLQSGTPRHWDDDDLQWLWEQFEAGSRHRNTSVVGRPFMFKVIDRLLERAGALHYLGGAVDEGSAPGFSSTYSLLYAETPEADIGRALERLDAALR